MCSLEYLTAIDGLYRHELTIRPHPRRSQKRRLSAKAKPSAVDRRVGQPRFGGYHQRVITSSVAIDYQGVIRVDDDLPRFGIDELGVLFYVFSSSLLSCCSS